jgi:phage tail-like protein
MATADTSAGFVHLRGRDLWLRASFEDAALLGDVVQLAWTDVEDAGAVIGPAPPEAAGLAFDSFCRLYHSLPAQGSVERLRWAQYDPLDLTQNQAEALPLFAPPAGMLAGDFGSSAVPTPLAAPRGLAVDADDLLYVAEAGGHAVLVMDLVARTQVRRIGVAGRPLALAAQGRDVWLITETPAALFRLRGRGAMVEQPLPAASTAPSRIAIGPAGQRLLLDAAASAGAQVIDLADPTRLHALPWATDLAFQKDDSGAPLLVVARRPGESFLRLALMEEGFAEAGALSARGYDGLGIVTTLDNRILYWTAQGPRHAVAARPRYGADARIVGCRLDGGEFQRRWGRIFVDACLPRETALTLQCISTDDDDTPDDQRLLRQPPANLPDPEIAHDGLSPPMPEATRVLARAAVSGRVVRRINGSELPWLPHDPEDSFATYEATGTEERGRYLWLVLVLAGNTRVTPRVRAVRVESPAHDLLRRLPQVLWREDASASFLQRFLAPLAGLVGELDARARQRRALLDPAATPPEALAWLAGFLGLAFDQRWSVAVRRRLIADLMPLFRQRGTVAGLRRFITLVTGVEPVIVEQFRLRGGAVIGHAEPGGSRAIVGAGLRVGGRVGDPALAPLDQAAVDDAFETHAHRFTVMLPALLNDDTLALADWVLERHRPAHTLVTLCSAGSGLRVGRGLHVGLTSVVGRSSGWQTLQLGATALGRDAVVGWPRPGLAPAASRLGLDTRVG